MRTFNIKRHRAPLYILFTVVAIVFFITVFSVYIYSNAESIERQAGRPANQTLVGNATCDPDFGECGEDLSHGVCWYGKCVCAAEWHGNECEIANLETEIERCGPEDDCSLHGECFFGKCFCYPGFTGVQCNLRLHRDRYCSMSENDCGTLGQCVLSETNVAECYCPISGVDLSCMLI